MTGLSKDLPAPLYVQLKDLILRAIESGQWKTDEQIPSEDALVARFGVSKITVRQALRELADLGYVRREQGRGTFVQRPQLAQGPRELTSFTEEMRRHGWVASSRIVSRGLTPATEDVAEKLELRAGEQVFRLRRLRLADGEPMGIQTAYLPARLAPGIEDLNFTGASLYEVIHTHFGLYPVNAKERHTAVAVGKAEARLLGVEPGSPAMAAERVAYLAGQRPLEYVRSIMRGDRYSIVLDLVTDSERS